MADTRTGAIPQWVLTDRLTKARTSAGLEQEELAEKMGVSRQSISNWERGYAKPKRPMIYMWADLCEVDRHWLIWGEPPPDNGDAAPPPGFEPGTSRLTAGRSGRTEVPDSWVNDFRKLVTVRQGSPNELVTS